MVVLTEESLIECPNGNTFLQVSTHSPAVPPCLLTAVAPFSPYEPWDFRHDIMLLWKRRGGHSSNTKTVSRQ